MEGGVSVSWEASRGSKTHKVKCADLDRHQVGFVDVEDGKSNVLIENVMGKYRLEITAFNEVGSSAPRKAFFDCSRDEVEKRDDLEEEFKDWDKEVFKAPVRAEKDVGKGLGVDLCWL